MINHILIKNFAIIENTEIDLEDGLNIITGETGSGKSIVIEAISLALGSRADSSYVRTGSEKAVIQLAGTLNEDEIVITREISAAGKNLCRLNGEIVTLNQLHQVAKQLADIHGQYDNQSLLHPESHIIFLDAYHHEEIEPLKVQVKEAHRQYSQARTALAKLLSTEKENTRKLDFFRYETEEIQNAALVPGEDKELEDKISLLQNSGKIYENLEKAYLLLHDETPSAMDGFRAALRSLEEISSYTGEIGQLCQEFNDIYYRLEDLSHNLRNKKESLIFNPAELDEAISRFDQIETLKKKYGSTIEEILAYYEKVSKELAVIENFDESKVMLEKQLKSSYTALITVCEKLTDARKRSAAELEVKIQNELVDLNFSDAKMKISVTPLEKPEENGMDQVEILISTNKGEPLKPLFKIASGGEMSRIMLAFKNIISAYDEIPTLIFDEIDTGISGITASIVGRKLKEISKEHQIICITHLPQIAACGDHNFRIFKESNEKNTFTCVEPLDQQQRIREIARLLGGDSITETTLQSAKELIERQHQ